MKVSLSYSTNQSISIKQSNSSNSLNSLIDIQIRISKMRKDMYVSTFPGHLKQVGLGLVLFPIYSKMHYGFNYVGSKHLYPSTLHIPNYDAANDTTRHGKQHGNTHSRSAGSNISNFKRAVGSAMRKACMYRVV